MKQEIEVIRTKRKSIAIEITPDCRIRVRAPLKMNDSEIQSFISEKNDWIVTHLEKMAKQQLSRIFSPVKPLTSAEIRELADRAAVEIPEKVEKYSRELGVSYGRITIRNQKTRWGSCSSKGNLNFNCLLMLTPDDVQNYVVVHELCHRREMNHSPRFWALVEGILPDYKNSRRWLKENGIGLIERMG